MIDFDLNGRKLVSTNPLYATYEEERWQALVRLRLSTTLP
jgi:hypothetical protein